MDRVATQEPGRGGADDARRMRRVDQVGIDEHRRASTQLQLGLGMAPQLVGRITPPGLAEHHPAAPAISEQVTLDARAGAAAYHQRMVGVAMHLVRSNQRLSCTRRLCRRRLRRCRRRLLAICRRRWPPADGFRMRTAELGTPCTCAGLPTASAASALVGCCAA